LAYIDDPVFVILGCLLLVPVVAKIRGYSMTDDQVGACLLYVGWLGGSAVASAGLILANRWGPGLAAGAVNILRVGPSSSGQGTRC
jgi:hypothetical protein